MGSTGDHYGFRTISNEVLLGLQAYIARRLEQGTLSENVKIWITGYSRASACANLTAAMLTDGYMEKAHDLVIPPENIYAYCFEVPQGTTDTDRVIGYENIFNIVNPIDPVPKVAPVGWGFGRYGITYYLPSAETDPDYSRQLMEATREYTRIVKGTTENGLVALKQLTGQGAKLDAILSGITLAVSRKTYAEELEPILVPAISRVTQEGDGRPYTDQLALGIVEVLRKHPIKFMRVTDILTKVLGSPLTACIVGETVTEQVLSAIGFKGSSSFSTLELALSTMFHAHYPELTLAWMHTVTDFDGNDVDPWYRRLYVNCPVDLSVYDSEGVLVAQFIADEPQFIEGSMIPAFLDGAGQKIIILPPGEEYRVEITATDDGTMSYAVAECHAENGQAERLLHYYDVEITEGDALTAELPVAEEMQAEEYPLFMAEEEIEVSETLEISAEQEAIPTYTIELEVLGDAEVMGGGIYLRGEYAQLSYTSDNPFLGWYEDGQLLSVDPEYRFRMEGDRNIRAEFDYTDITGLSVDPEGRISAAVYRLPEGTSALLTAALYENEQLKDLQTITVEDDGRYVFDRLVHRNGLEYRVFLTGTDVWLPLCRKKGYE
ncbi:MAG: hypothetical protein IIY00_03485 [Clostridia bacterium]|nr:hypothetical protein [Clostridia bacterium]